MKTTLKDAMQMLKERYKIKIILTTLNINQKTWERWAYKDGAKISTEFAEKLDIIYNIKITNNDINDVFGKNK